MSAKIKSLINKCRSAKNNLSGITYCYTENSSQEFQISDMDTFIEEYCKLAYEDLQVEENEINPENDDSDESEVETEDDQSESEYLLKKVKNPFKSYSDNSLFKRKNKVNPSMLGFDLAEVITSNNSPIIIDFNLIFTKSDEKDVTETDDYYTEMFYYTIVYSIQQLMRDTIDLSQERSELVCCFLESVPVLRHNKFHMQLRFQFPYCQLNNAYQREVFYPELIERLQNNSVLKLMKKLPIGDLESIILRKKDYVTMFRSKEKHCAPMKLRCSIPDVDYNDIKNGNFLEMELNDVFIPKAHTFIAKNIVNENFLADGDVSHEFLLPFLLSIHFCESISKVKEVKKSNDSYSLNSSRDGEINDKDPRVICENLLPLLSSERFKRADYWIIVGKCLFNIFDGDERGLTYWSQYSEELGIPERSKEKCKIKYFSFRENDYTIRTLARFARDDNRDLYNQWHEEWCQDSLNEALSGIHNDVTEAIYRVFWLDLIFTGEGKNPWYYYDKNSWKNTKKAMYLRKAINDLLIPIFKNLRVQASAKSYASKKNDKNIEITISQVSSMVKRLGTMGYKSSLISMSEEKFYNSFFEEKKDKNHLCTGWKNGVIECCGDIAFFREGIPEDYITMNTRLHFHKDFTWNHPLVIELMDWLRKVFCDEGLLRYFLKDSASHLVGKNSEKMFRVWTGGTNASKSVIMKLFKAVFGQYCVDLPLSIITKTLPGGSGPTPELTQLRGAHVGFFSEPDETDELQAGKIKRGTGGDSFYARSCGEDGGSIENYASFILITNEIPYLPNIDEAIMKRFAFLPFLSKFALDAPEDPEEQKRKRIFKMDPFFEERIPELASAFAWVLVEYYPLYKKEGLIPPSIIVKYTEDHWKNVDPYLRYINEKIEIVYIDKEQTKVDKSIKKSPPDLYSSFSKWFKSRNPGLVIPSSAKFEKEIVRPGRLGPLDSKGKWTGVDVKKYIPSEETKTQQ